MEWKNWKRQPEPKQVVVDSFTGPSHSHQCTTKPPTSGFGVRLPVWKKRPPNFHACAIMSSTRSAVRLFRVGVNVPGWPARNLVQVRPRLEPGGTHADDQTRANDRATFTAPGGSGGSQENRNNVVAPLDPLGHRPFGLWYLYISVYRGELRALRTPSPPRLVR